MAEFKGFSDLKCLNQTYSDFDFFCKIIHKVSKEKLTRKRSKKRKTGKRLSRPKNLTLRQNRKKRKKSGTVKIGRKKRKKMKQKLMKRKRNETIPSH